jgi:hypothetical protein
MARAALISAEGGGVVAQPVAARAAAAIVQGSFLTGGSPLVDSRQDA